MKNINRLTIAWNICVCIYTYICMYRYRCHFLIFKYTLVGTYVHNVKTLSKSDQHIITTQNPTLATCIDH